MSDGYYSGDKPNVNLQAFSEAHARQRPYDVGKDDYSAPAFDKPIDTTKATAIYNMHGYSSKKPHDAIRQYIRHYTETGDLVLDTFCGSGSTTLASLMEGRKAIAIDRSPAATFITKNYCIPVSARAIREGLAIVRQAVEGELGWLYETRCDRCGGPALTTQTVYSQTFRCPRCTKIIPLFDCAEIDGQTAKGKPKKVRVCPHCQRRGQREVIRSQSEKLGVIPVQVNYVCRNGCRPSHGERRHDDQIQSKREYFETCDLAKIAEIEAKAIPHWYPAGFDMTGFSRYKRDALRYYGVSEIADLYTKRNLWAIAAILERVNAITSGDARDALRFAMSGIVLGLSRMNRYMPGATFPFYLVTGTYYVPQISCEEYVWKHFENKAERLVKGYGAIQSALGTSELMISTQSATDIAGVPANTVDYVFTDPPYGDKVQYGELNFVWEAWLGLDTHWHDQEIIVNEERGRTEADWTNMMRQAMAECFRVLKPARWLSLCYHDTSEGTWALVQDLMAEVGFVVDKSSKALFIDTQQKSFNQLNADKVTKRDLVINFRKPRLGEAAALVLLTGNEDTTSFGDKARAIIRDYLDAHPGSTKDRVYDELVSRMVRAGQMERHDFEELLGQVAEEVREPVKDTLFRDKDPDVFGRHEIGRWYLKETALAVIDEAETSKEDSAAGQVRKLIADRLKENPGEEGVHYSDVFEHYVYTVKDKPRRPLAEWLLDYFYKTDTSTYRLPAGEEEKAAKAEGRERGTNRRIKRYLASLEQGIEIPASQRPGDATLAEWIRHCKRSGMYEQGRLLYERGGLDVSKLSERAAADVEEDYQVCVRIKART